MGGNLARRLRRKLLAIAGSDVVISPDIYLPDVGDRRNNRIQVFRPDGIFVQEGYVERKTLAEEGTTFDIGFSPDKQHRFLYVPDGVNKKVQILVETGSR